MDPKVTAALISAIVAFIGVLSGYFMLRIKAKNEKEKILYEIRKELSLDDFRIRREFASTLEQLRISLYKLWAATANHQYKKSELIEKIQESLGQVETTYTSYEEKWASSKSTFEPSMLNVSAVMHHELRHVMLSCVSSTRDLLKTLKRAKSEEDARFVQKEIVEARGAADRFIKFLAVMESESVKSLTNGSSRPSGR